MEVEKVKVEEVGREGERRRGIRRGRREKRGEEGVGRRGKGENEGRREVDKARV